MNTFGDTTNQFPLYDPVPVRANRMRFKREPSEALEQVNSFYCPSGRLAAHGWLLMARADYNQLNTYSTALQLNLGNTTLANNVGTLKNLAIVQAQCATRGLAFDSNALYIIEITDARGILHNGWFQAPTTSFYNIRAPAYPQTFLTDSMNGGTTWTWATMLQNLWAQMPLLGSWPGLPSTPAGTPEGFWLVGTPAWYALNDVLDHIGMTVACDLTQANPYTIVTSGDDDATFDALQTRYATNLEDDLEWIDSGAGRVPKTIKVLFRRRNSIYGTEETVRYDSLQWSTTPVYSVTVTAPAAFTSAVGSHYLWSDFTMRYDMDGAPLAADVATAASIAQERVAQYFTKIYSAAVGFMTQTYAGALPFSTGSQVDCVRWYQTLNKNQRLAWRTEITRGRLPSWPGTLEE